MNLTVLTDNCAGAGFLAEHGLSYLIETQGEKILLDTGDTDVFLHNAEKLGINIHSEVDTVVLSHGHWDHGNGLRFIEGKTLLTHSKSFMERFRAKDNSPIGLSMTKNEVAEKFNLILSDQAYKLKPNVFYLGGIPRKTTFESATSPFIDSDKNPDYVPDDSALAIVENNELIIVSGCSHSGICNIVSYAMEVTGIKKVKAIIGGLHLKYDNVQTQETIKFLKQNNIQEIYPSHCTALGAKVAFAREFKLQEVKTGATITL